MKGNLRKERIGKEERIKKKSQFNVIFKGGKKVDSEKLRVYFIKNDKNISRFNTVTSKKLGNAVLRNRIKRMINEVYRRNKESFGENIDWIFIPKGRWEKIEYYFTERLILDVIKGIKKKIFLKYKDPRKKNIKKNRIFSYFFVFLIIVYQNTFSPILGRNCRFIPTCSSYSILAIKKYGLIWGLIISTKRVLKCHPWSKGGYDPVP